MELQAWENNDEDREYREAHREYYGIYNLLRKRRALRESFHFDPKSHWIQIWEYKNNGEVKLICRVKGENAAECFRIAAEHLRQMERL